MKIIDCFMFCNELTLLQLRLKELYDVVDHFVLVESNISFTGTPKPTTYNDNKHMFAQYAVHLKSSI